MGVIGPAQLSPVTSQISVDRAETIAITTVLKQLGNPVPPMNAKAQATLEKIRSAASGQAFDCAYMDAQYENHVFLRDLATAYLANSPADTTDIGQMHGRHLQPGACTLRGAHDDHSSYWG